MMYYIVGKPKPLATITPSQWSTKDARQNTPIAIIDDQPFAYSELLKGHNYLLTELGDPKDLRILSAFDIIVCDIRGVGIHLGGKTEGGHLIQEIRFSYPDKYIIAFSASNRFDPSVKKFLDAADIALKKDASIEEWSNTLDNAINDVGHPVLRWKRARAMLIKHGTELHDVMEIEQKYINAVLTGRSEKLGDAIRSRGKLSNHEQILRLADSLAGFTLKMAKIIAAI